MQSLAIKYRPKSFNEVVEQRSIKQILIEQINTKSHKNCYLFTGGAGTGKTTCARIFSNELNQHQGNPIEIDAASNNGVENVREIINQAKFKALDAEYKIYIIDECHMLSTGAWNALLKVIEEPPAKTLFLFCTTDPQKIPNTILSRVQRYDFTRISFDGIINQLQHIMNEEKIIYNLDALSYIAKLAEGGMRDAITLLDKCVSYAEIITVDSVVEALGVINYNSMFDLTNFLYQSATDKVIILVEEIYRQGLDLKRFIKQYSYFVLDICKYELLNDFKYIQIPSTFIDRLDNIDEEFYNFVSDILYSIIRLSVDVKWETMPKPMIEACLISISKGRVHDGR